MRRVHSPEDRRLVLLELTDAGLVTIDRVYEEHVALERQTLGELSPAERDQLTAALRKLVHSVRRLSAGSQARGH